MKKRLALSALVSPQFFCILRRPLLCLLGFYSLFSVTEEPFVSSGGKSCLLYHGASFDYATFQTSGWVSIGKIRKTK